MLASKCSLDQEKVCPCVSSSAAPDQWRAGLLRTWLFRSTSLFSQVDMPFWFSTSSLSRDLLLARQASAAKGLFAGPRCVHGFVEKDVRMTRCSVLHVCWRQLRTRQKKGDTVYVCGFIGVRWRRVGNPTKTKRRKSLRRSAPCTDLLRLNELSFARWPQASQPLSAAPGNAADKMRTDRKWHFIDIDDEDARWNFPHGGIFLC